MKVTASELARKSNRRILEDMVKEQTRLIDSAILVAHTGGFDSITHDLPVDFQINNFDKSDAQTYVYSELIDIYTRPESSGGKGFDKVFLKQGTRPRLLVSWTNGLTSKERQDRRDAIIKRLA